MTRQATLDVLRSNPNVSVLIIGGGVNGIGLLRELALQGVDALLVEKSDYCAGTSAASTRIIHGGLRYLENGEFRLVREAILERNRLLRNAAHYVRPLPITIPVFNWLNGMVHAVKKLANIPSKPASRGALVTKIGLSLYDFFTRSDQVMPQHRFTAYTQALQQRPQLTPNIVATATYYDARIAYPERLCLEMILDAAEISLSARALNYVGVESAAGDSVTLRDEVTGTTLTVKPKIVVNATGAWIDLTNRAMQRPTTYIGGTKGSHVVLDHPELVAAARGEMLYFVNTDGRVCIFYPFYDKIIAGSTDLPVDDPDSAVCDDDEVDYILESMRQVFPTMTIDRSQIVYRYSGVRPLPRMKAATTGQISRDHSCEVLPPGDGVNFSIYSLVGGKWTTFRAFAEQVTDRLLTQLGRSRLIGSADLAIGGGQKYPRAESDKQTWLANLASVTNLPDERLAALLDRYGTRAEMIAAYLADDEADAPLKHHPGYTRREIEFLAHYEQVVHIDDVILRRTLIGILGGTTLDLIDELAAILAPVLGWSDATRQAEIERTATLLQQRHGIVLAI